MGLKWWKFWTARCVGATAILFLTLLLWLFSLATPAQAESAFIKQIKALAHSPEGLVQRVDILHASGGRVSWSPNGKWIAMDRKSADGYYDLYLISPDGSRERCVTCNANDILGRGHHGQPAWHPSGRYIVFQSQKAEGVGHFGRDIAALPGAGHNSDLWLVDLKARTFHQLTRTAPGGASGVLHPHFSPDGGTLSWTDGLTPASLTDRRRFAGFWQLSLADFRVTPDGPELRNFRNYKPGGDAFYENHGFSKDGRKLIFTSSYEMGPRDHFLTSTKIYQLDLRNGKLTRLAGKGYNEIAHTTPSGRHIVWMTSRENPNRGTDYWVMAPDGANKRRVTDFNNPDIPGYRRRMIIAADHSFAPDGKRFAAFLQTNLVTQEGMTVVITLNPEQTRPF